MTDAQMYAEALRYMARLPYGDWRRNVDNQWLMDAADEIEQAVAPPPHEGKPG